MVAPRDGDDAHRPEVRELELELCGVDAELRRDGEIGSSLAQRIGGTGEPLGGEF